LLRRIKIICQFFKLKVHDLVWDRLDVGKRLVCNRLCLSVRNYIISTSLLNINMVRIFWLGNFLSDSLFLFRSLLLTHSRVDIIQFTMIIIVHLMFQFVGTF